MSTHNEYDLGASVRAQGTFKNAGVVANPAEVFVKVKAPDGTLDTYEYGVDLEVVRESTGVYYIDIVADQAGDWYYRWLSTGGIAARERNFKVRTAQCTP